jgi:D-alanine-D-alanine ligase
VPRFAEVFVEGREFNLSLLASPEGAEVLPVAEIRFDGFPSDKPRIVGYAAKWEPDSFECRHTRRHFPDAAQDAALFAALRDLASLCWRCFGLAGHARVDFRSDAQGRPWVLEVNANPCLAPDAGFLAAAAQAGLAPADVLERILAAALPRAGG